jgi:hypothetical protein
MVKFKSLAFIDEEMLLEPQNSPFFDLDLFSYRSQMHGQLN